MQGNLDNIFFTDMNSVEYNHIQSSYVLSNTASESINLW